MTNFAVLTPPPFHVSSTRSPASFPYHHSISALWEKKWKPVCSKGVYPFVDGKLEDFEPIFAELVASANDDPERLYEPDAFATPFLAAARNLTAQAEQAETSGDTNSARDLYLRAGAVLRIARFPIIRSPKTREACQLQKDFYLRGGKYLDRPVREVSIPFSHADPEQGDTPGVIPAYLRVPSGPAPTTQGWPTLLFICGLDSYRTDQTAVVARHVALGFAVLAFEIPGTGDCPASRTDPHSPDRLMSSVIDWVHSRSSSPSEKASLDVDGDDALRLDATRLFAAGVSTGSYYASRLAHTHAVSLRAVVAQGAGTHYMFHPDWIRSQDRLEYPFGLAEAIAYKFGFDSSSSSPSTTSTASPAGSNVSDGVEAFIATNPMSTYGLLTSEIVGRPNCRVLLVNGVEDTVFPIEDSVLFALAGASGGKDLVTVAGEPHMGGAEAERVIGEWLKERLAEC